MEKSFHTDKLPIGFRGSEIINKPEKMAENHISLLSAGTRLNADPEI